MKITANRAMRGAGALAVAGGLLFAAAGTALAAPPAFEPDPNTVGALTLTDSTGAPITSGLVNAAAPISAFAIGGKASQASDTKATLFGCTPQQGVNPSNWSCEQLSSSTTYSPAPGSQPVSVSSTGLPVVTGSSGDTSLSTFIGDFPNNLSVAGYTNIYELRLATSSATGHATDATVTYDSLDIQVTGTGPTDTWSVVYPTGTDATTTSLSASPASPVVTSNPTVPVTLTATVAPATAVPASYTGPIGTVQFFDGATQVGATKLVGNTAPYTASVSTTQSNPSNSSFTAKFTPYNGPGLTGSASSALLYHVGQPVPSTSTTLAVNPGTNAGDTNAYKATVANASSQPVCAGTVSFFDNGGAAPLNSSPVAATGTPCEFDFSNAFSTPGSHSIVAMFTPTDPNAFAASQSAAVTFSQTADPNGPCAAANGGNCTDVQNIEADIPVGTLSITTPYSATAPLNLGTLALDATDTKFTANAPFTGIAVTDTRSGALPWTVNVLGQQLSDGGSNPGSKISAENLGLTSMHVDPVSGNGFDVTAANLTTTNNPAASPAVAPADAGSSGLGGAAAHLVAHAAHGTGSVGFDGLLTLNAPTSTESGHFTGTVTFTIVGS